MEKSDKEIDYRAYAGFMRQVSAEAHDNERIAAQVMARIGRCGTEMHTAGSIFLRIGMAASVVLLLAFGTMLYGYYATDIRPGHPKRFWLRTEFRQAAAHGSQEEGQLWAAVRAERPAQRKTGIRLYDAYVHSEALRNLAADTSVKCNIKW